LASRFIQMIGQIKKNYSSKGVIMGQRAVAEATLEDLLRDPVGQIMMDRDGVTVEDVRHLMDIMRHRLFEPKAAGD
jgi:hypothetical protein